MISDRIKNGLYERGTAVPPLLGLVGEASGAGQGLAAMVELTRHNTARAGLALARALGSRGGQASKILGPWRLDSGVQTAHRSHCALGSVPTLH